MGPQDNPDHWAGSTLQGVMPSSSRMQLPGGGGQAAGTLEFTNFNTISSQTALGRRAYKINPMVCLPPTRHAWRFPPSPQDQVRWAFRYLVHRLGKAKHLPTVKKIWIRFLDGEDLLRREWQLTPRDSCLRIPWPEEPSGLQSTGSQELQTQLSSDHKPRPHPTGTKV